MSNLVQFQNDIIIDQETKEAFTSIMGAARICFGEERHVAEEYKIRRFLSSANIELETVQIQTAKGLRTSARVTESLLMELIAKYNPSLLPELAKAGLRAYLYSLAGYQINATPIKQFDIPKTYAEALRLAADYSEQIEEMKPKAEFHDAVTNSNGCIDMMEMAKILGTGRTRLFKWLRDQEVIQKNSTLPYQQYIDCGYFKVVETYIKDLETPVTKTIITGKGQVWITKKFVK